MIRISEIQQLPEFLETFPGNFSTICPCFLIFESFGWMESALWVQCHMAGIWCQRRTQHVNNTWFLLFCTFHFVLIGWAVLGSQPMERTSEKPRELSWVILLFFLTYPWKFPRGHLGESSHTKKLLPCGQQPLPMSKRDRVTAPNESSKLVLLLQSHAGKNRCALWSDCHPPQWRRQATNLVRCFDCFCSRPAVLAIKKRLLLWVTKGHFIITCDLSCTRAKNWK